MRTPTAIDPGQIPNASNASAGVLARTPDFMAKGTDGKLHGVYVQRGPVWLAKLLYRPPEWLLVLLAVVVIIVVLAAIVQYRRLGLDADTKQQMAANVLTISCMAIATKLSIDVVGVPYLAAIVLGPLLGIAIARSVLRGMHQRAA